MLRHCYEKLQLKIQFHEILLLALIILDVKAFLLLSSEPTLLAMVTETLLGLLTVSCPATPKSASLAWPSVFSRMFPALMSLWIFLVKCRYSRPFRVDCRMVAISSSVSCSTQMQQISNNTADERTCAYTETVYRLIANPDDVGH